MDEAERDLLRRSFEFAIQCHGSQTRKGSEIPYLSHLLQVAGLVFEHGGSATQAAAGLLHDAVEDCDDVSLDAIRERFGARVAQIVECCTDTRRGGSAAAKGPWRERKERYLEQLGAADAETALVAACDKRHNLGTLVADVWREGPSYLDRFNAGPAEQSWYYARVLELLGDRVPPALRRDLEQLLDQLRALLDGGVR